MVQWILIITNLNLFIWYDNEWSYVFKVIQLLEHMISFSNLQIYKFLIIKFLIISLKSYQSTASLAFTAGISAPSKNYFHLYLLVFAM